MMFYQGQAQVSYTRCPTDTAARLPLISRNVVAIVSSEILLSSAVFALMETPLHLSSAWRRPFLSAGQSYTS